MALANLSPIFEPQWVSNGAAALTFAQGGTVVPAGYNYQIGVARCVNTTGAPVTLKVWRVPNGQTNDNQHIVVPVTVQVPVATQTFPHFDVTVLWGAVLQPGDAIYAVAGSATALAFNADGMVIQL